MKQAGKMKQWVTFAAKTIADIRFPWFSDFDPDRQGQPPNSGFWRFHGSAIGGIDFLGDFR